MRFFESFSGLTTTGATTLVGLDSLPHAILFYRQMLQWFGGMGIIVLAVAILPILGVGGMQLYRAEMPGPLKDNKMRPRIAETAKNAVAHLRSADHRLRAGAVVCRDAGV
nr:Potassium uptake protein TrkH [Raoultella sp. NCTC 9187]